MKISSSPVPEIPGFLRRPFIKGKLVKHPIPDDPAESIHNEKCVRTKAQKAWTYLCALLQFWTDQAHHRIWRCDVRRPAPAHESDDRADLSHTESKFRRSFPNNLGLHRNVHFLDSGPPLLWRVRQGAIPDGARPNCRSTEPHWNRRSKKDGKGTSTRECSRPRT